MSKTAANDNREVRMYNWRTNTVERATQYEMRMAVDAERMTVKKGN